MAAAAGLMLVGCSSPETTETTTSASAAPERLTTERSTTTTPAQLTPPYSVVGQLEWRKDGEPTYYIAIDPVDLSNDGFKQTIKLITQKLAEDDGNADFSAKFYDDQSVAEQALSTDPGSGNHTLPDKAALDLKGQHLVAIYGGGLEAALYPYELMWYPSASTDTPNVGHWVGSEEWKPPT